MSLLDSLITAASGKPDPNAAPNPLVTILGNVLAQSGGVQGLMGKFSQAGLGNVFSAWVSTGPNPPITGDQLRQALGSDQINALAAKLGVDPAQASQIIAEHLPAIVDKLTPGGEIDPSANVQEQLSNLVPLLLQKLTSGKPQS